MGKILKIFLAVVICILGVSLAREVVTDSDTQIPVISDLLWSIHLNTEEKEVSIDAEPFYEIEDTPLFREDEAVLENQVVSLSYEGDSFTSVSLQISQVNLAVGMASENTLYAETEEVSRYQAYVEEETLYIVIEGTLSAQNAVQGESVLPQVTILLPSGFALTEGEMELEVLAGNAVLQNLTLSALEITLNAGAISIDGLSTGQFAVTMLAGSVTGQNLTVAESALFTMSAGSMSLTGDLSTEVAAEVTAGNLSLSLEQPYESYDCEVTCAAGSVTVAGEAYSGLTASETIRHGGANTLTVNCSVGVVDVEFAGEEL
ncbi:MAG: DUF4097 family beta strand repeat-containing protein [Lachnospiraceae bacterium]|nr:DUF4097 family beta strand repeat-containing protein [Lachnospiraceae bacterium]